MNLNWNRSGKSILSQSQIDKFCQSVKVGRDAASKLIIIEVENEELGAVPNVWDLASKEVFIKTKSAKFRELTKLTGDRTGELVATKEQVTKSPGLSQLGVNSSSQHIFLQIKFT